MYSSSSDSSDEELFNYLRNRRQPKVFKERKNHFDELLDQEFFHRFRFTKPTVENILSYIENDIKYTSERNICLSPMQQLLLTLRFFASGCMLISTGDFMGVTKATASRTVRRVSEAIARLRPMFIKFPQSAEEVRQTQLGFNKISKFPRVVGTIDCTHIKIQSPGDVDAEVFRNRKGYFSYNVQTVSSYDLKITNIVARWPGSAHDQTIFNNCNLKHLFETTETYRRCFLLGDSGYRNNEYLLTPLLNTNDAAQEMYNRCHIKTRNTVERQYGLWKRRFPILSLGMRVSSSLAKTIIVASAVLHNIAIDMNDPLPINGNIVEEMEQADIYINEELVNNNIRQNIIYNYFNTLL